LREQFNPPLADKLAADGPSQKEKKQNEEEAR
jgi:hypothetical protein